MRDSIKYLISPATARGVVIVAGPILALPTADWMLLAAGVVALGIFWGLIRSESTVPFQTLFHSEEPVVVIAYSNRSAIWDRLIPAAYIFLAGVLMGVLLTMTAHAQTVVHVATHPVIA